MITDFTQEIKQIPSSVPSCVWLVTQKFSLDQVESNYNSQSMSEKRKSANRPPSMFERYTEEARRAIFFAHLEAVHQSKESISAGHILLGVTWDEKSRACQIGSLKDNAVALRAALNIPHLPSTSIPYLDKREIPLDNDGKKTLAYASMEADVDKQYWLDTDHLLRGLLRFKNPAAEALQKANLDLDTLRSASRTHRVKTPAEPKPSWANYSPFRERSKQLLLGYSAPLVILGIVILLILVVLLRNVD